MSLLLRSLLLLLLCCYAVTALELTSTSPWFATSSSLRTMTSSNHSPSEASSSSPPPTEDSYPPSSTPAEDSYLPTETTEDSYLPSHPSPTTKRDAMSYYVTRSTDSSPGYSASTIAHATCPESDQIHCKNSDRCTRIRYICDGDNDCGDNSDEASSLCRAWRNSECERNNARCRRNGRSDCITITHYCELSDPPCEGNVDLRLCKMLSDERIQDLDSILLETTTVVPTVPIPTYPSVHYTAEDLTEEFKVKLDASIRHKECPQLYTKIGDQCVSIFFIGNLTWMESRAFCQAIGGDLFTIKPDLSNFLTILQHFNKNQVTKDFWIGGLYKNDSLGWQWVDDTEMQVGSPIWAIRHYDQCSTRMLTSPVLNITMEANSGYCYHYQQAPRSVFMGHCSAITYENYFYVSDEDCTVRKSPLCVLPEEHPKQGT